MALDPDRNLIYALKPTYNEFFAYRIDSNKWSTLTSLPLTGTAGRKKVKDGAGLAYQGNMAYALKGGNTLEFWSYFADSNLWVERENFPFGTGRRVKGGGALVHEPGGNVLYATKGNNTREFYYYYPLPGADRALAGAGRVNAEGSSRPPAADLRLEIFPNPFSRAVTVDYSLPQAGPVSLKLYDIRGTLVRTLVEGHQPAGLHSICVRVRSSGVPSASGIYLLRLETGNSGLATSVLTRKLILR
jgi:hypothetical protein